MLPVLWVEARRAAFKERADSPAAVPYPIEGRLGAGPMLAAARNQLPPKSNIGLMVPRFLGVRTGSLGTCVCRIAQERT